MESANSAIQFRYAVMDDVPALTRLIERSVRGLQADDYSPEQIEGALGSVLGVDTQLIADETYFVAERIDGSGKLIAVGCGGWSKRKTLFGSDHGPDRANALLDPEIDPAKIRAIFVHPKWARCGVGSKILAVCETAAAAAGFSRFEMGSTLTGVPLYSRRGYQEYQRIQVPLPNGLFLPVVRMTKRC